MGLLQPGDSILFKRGDLFSGHAVLTASGAADHFICFSSYGEGELPVISGLVSLEEWVLIGGNIWEAQCPSFGQMVSNLLIQGVPQQMGRYPNSDESNGGYLPIESHTGNQTISNTNLNGIVDWTGGEAIIRIRRFTMDRIGIGNHQGGSLSLQNPTYNEIIDGFGFFIQNHPATLDRDGEWYYDAIQKKVLLFSTTNPNSLNIEATRLTSLFTVDSREYFKLEEIEFRGSSEINVSMVSAGNFELSNCLITLAGLDGINIYGCNDFIVAENTIKHSNNNGIFIENCRDAKIHHNNILSTGLRPGMISDNLHQCTAAFLEGFNCTFEMNTIDSVGYNGIYFIGDQITVRNNHISNFCSTLEDGGGIYSWNGNRLLHTSRNVINNVITDGIGSPEGTDDPSYRLVVGIYLDQAVDHVLMEKNSISNCAYHGIYISNGNHFTIIGNTMFNNGTQLCLNEDNRMPNTEITDCVVRENIFFSKISDQNCLLISTLDDSNISGFGNFDNNYYCRPEDDFQFIDLYDYSVSSGKQISLKEWQETYGFDQNSTSSPYLLPMYEIEQWESGNLINNANFDEDINGWNCVSNYLSCDLFWEESTSLGDGNLGLNVSQSSGAEDGYVHVHSEFGESAAGSYYIANFSAIASSSQSARITMYNARSPYDNIAAPQYTRMGVNRSSHTILLKPDQSQADARIEFMFGDNIARYWLDNVSLRKALIEITQTADSIDFISNPSESELINDDGLFYIDPKGEISRGYTIPPFGSRILMEVDSSFQPVHSEYTQITSLVVYPNPAKHMIHFFSEDSGPSLLTIIDLSGRVVHQKNYAEDLIRIDVSSFAQGLYLASIVGKYGKKTSIFVIQ